MDKTFIKNHKILFSFTIITVVLLIVFRIFLPSILLSYAENVLNKLPDYSGHIKDIEINFFHGNYVIKGLEIKKNKSAIPSPFFSAESIELAIEWPALLKRHIVGKIFIANPTINFVVDPSGKDEQLSINRQWKIVVKNLFPLNLNRIIVVNGQIHLRSFKGTPPFDIYLKNVNGEVSNLRKISKSENLLSSFLSFTAETMDGAHVGLDMDFDPFARQPTFVLDADIEKMQVKYINSFLKHYINIDVKQGLFSLYLEAAAKNGKIVGYVKPIMENLKIIDPKQENLSPVEALYKGALQLVTKIVENPQKKTVATKINISGNIDDPDISIWSVVTNLLRNAFIQALLPKIDNSIEISDIKLQ